MMSFTIIIRGVVYVVLAVTLLATAIALNNRQYQPEGTLPAEHSPATDNLDAELARCKALGTKAANDAACKAAWRTNREHFFNSKKLFRDRVTDSAPAASHQNQSTPVVGSQVPSGAPVPANRAGQPQ